MNLFIFFCCQLVSKTVKDLRKPEFSTKVLFSLAVTLSNSLYGFPSKAMLIVHKKGFSIIFCVQLKWINNLGSTIVWLQTYTLHGCITRQPQSKESYCWKAWMLPGWCRKFKHRMNSVMQILSDTKKAICSFDVAIARDNMQIYRGQFVPWTLFFTRCNFSKRSEPTNGIHHDVADCSTLSKDILEYRTDTSMRFYMKMYRCYDSINF